MAAAVAPLSSSASSTAIAVEPKAACGSPGAGNLASVSIGPSNGEGKPETRQEAPQRKRSRGGSATGEAEGMIPSGRKRLPLEAPLMRVVATTGIIGIGVAIAAIMTSQHSKGWLIGLVVSVVSVVLAAVLWSSRRL